jgi:hypothetical protein
MARTRNILGRSRKLSLTAVNARARRGRRHRRNIGVRFGRPALRNWLPQGWQRSGNPGPCAGRSEMADEAHSLFQLRAGKLRPPARRLGAVCR